MTARPSLLAALAIGLFGCDRPAPPPARAAVSYGSAMADVARRFELVGRALAAHRVELANYELGEIDEVFERTLPTADLPKEGHPGVLKQLAPAFARENLAELQRALAEGDDAARTAAFAQTAAACNACHQASGHGFIVVPSQPGQSVPDTTPLAR